jgi:hypothetical protein
LHTVLNQSSKTVTLIGEGGMSVTATAASHLNVCVRKDGGITVWYDGKPKSQTVRVTSAGALVAKPKRRKVAKRVKVSEKAVAETVANLRARHPDTGRFVAMTFTSA